MKTISCLLVFSIFLATTSAWIPAGFTKTDRCTLNLLLPSSFDSFDKLGSPTATSNNGSVSLQIEERSQVNGERILEIYLTKTYKPPVLLFYDNIFYDITVPNISCVFTPDKIQNQDNTVSIHYLIEDVVVGEVMDLRIDGEIETFFVEFDKDGLLKPYQTEIDYRFPYVKSFKLTRRSNSQTIEGHLSYGNPLITSYECSRFYSSNQLYTQCLLRGDRIPDFYYNTKFGQHSVLEYRGTKPINGKMTVTGTFLDSIENGHFQEWSYGGFYCQYIQDISATDKRIVEKYQCGNDYRGEWNKTLILKEYGSDNTHSFTYNPDDDEEQSQSFSNSYILKPTCFFSIILTLLVSFLFL
ncbi:hypothetical protein CYY_005748 [Polysphondylium violaceum]|uniref:Uncharacterized protein n=1 Tax=Polysphondylium violaceum TaxID=133409 RepID=A0A8J4Q2C7_9MYCE|nr:hypothetical protein CYY_005748 [Polysphondylium violaceum]